MSELKPLTKIPEKGFYYHYKHDPAGPLNNYAYEVIGVGHHTEQDGTYFVVYRPIYESSVYLEGKFFDVRPLEMFMEDKEIEGKMVERFKKITDESAISELTKIAQKMYGE